MALKDFKIELDNPWNKYDAGQTLNGKVTFTFDSPTKIRGIEIKFSGVAETKWTHTETKTDQEGKQYQSTTNLFGQEDYLQIQYYLLGGSNSKEMDLEAGPHKYPFTCPLPPTLPSSFEGEWGFVRYTIKVTLDRPFKFDPDIRMTFTVISPVDLNSNPRVMNPFKLELEKTFCCLCCTSGPLSLIVHIPVTGFVSGQTIPLTIECDNASNIRVESVQLILRKLMAFHVHNPRRDTKHMKEVISKISVGSVEGGNSQTWHQNILIPSLPPSNLVNCGIIDIDYDIKVEAVVSGLHIDLAGNIPVVLGTVPLSSFQSPPPYTDNPPEVVPLMMPTQSISPAPNGAGGVLGWNFTNGGDSLNPNIPPPTFEEAMLKAPNISNKNDSEYNRFIGPGYAPGYPTHTIMPSAPPEDL